MNDVKIAVIGGGITGQLVKIQAPEATVFDWKPPPVGDARKLTRSYGANYLWAPLPGIPCREFTVITHIDGKPATHDGIRAYKKKIGKEYDSHIGAPIEAFSGQFAPEMRGYEFTDFPKVDIHYNHRIVEIDRLNHVIKFADKDPVRYELLVSTIPLYSLLSLLGMPEPTGRLRYDPIFFKVLLSPPDAPYEPPTMYVNYLSTEVIPYRFTDRDRERHYESIVPYKGISSKRFVPGKIHPHTGVPEVLEFLEGFGIQTFGRFGSWNPDELLHETWDRIEDWNMWRTE